jgi:cysteine desulfurase
LAPERTRYATQMTRMPETYLDGASTTPVHPRARAALLAAVEGFGDPSRLYARGRRARLLLDRSREQLAAAVGAHPEEVVLTSGGT